MAVPSTKSMKRRFNVKPLSQQLADLSARAKKAEDDEAAARKEERAKIQARVDKLQADTKARAAKVDAAIVAAKDTAMGRWMALQKQVMMENDRIKADIDAKKAERDTTRAVHKADRAEDNAAEAISFAYVAIDYAESAVLDAVMARADANAVK
jgi:hypothetical protein